MSFQTELDLKELSSKRRRIVQGAAAKLIEELVHVADSSSLARLASTGQAAVDVVKLLEGFAASGKRLGQVLADLRAEANAEELDEEALEASGRLQILALYRSIEGESLSVGELQAAGISRQRLKQLRDQGRLLGIKLPFQRGFLYPRWQFEEDLRPKSFVPQITSVASEEGIDSVTLYRLMTRQAPGRPTLLELCEQGELKQACNALRSHGELGG